MPIHSISNFIDAFKGGTRPNRFIVTVLPQTGNAGAATVASGLASSTHAMAASLPESTVGVMPIPFRGRIYRFPGDRDYNTWSVTLLDDTNGIYSAWHAWSNLFNHHSLNQSNTRTQKEDMGTVTVQLLDHNSDTPLRTFTLYYAWPVRVGAYDLNMARGNEPGQFTCELAYAYLEMTTNSNDGAARALQGSNFPSPSAGA